MQNVKAGNKIKLATALLIIFIVSPSYSICQQHHFTLKVHFDNPTIKTLGIGEAYYYKLKPCNAAKIQVDSSNVNENTYLFEGAILYPTAVRLFTLNDSVDFNEFFFIDTGYQEISIIKKDSFYVINSSTDIEKEHKKFLNEMDIKTIDEKMQGEKLFSYVKKNPDSYVALFAIINQAFHYPYPAIFEKINDAFGVKIKQTEAFKYYVSLYAPNAIGNMAPDFSAKSLKGKKVTLSSFKGSVVLLDFWASWCQPCLKMIPHLKNIYQKYHSRGLEIISISVDTDSSMWKKAVKKEGMPWNNIISQSYDMKNHSEQHLDMKYNILGYPTTILINKKGTIIGRYTGNSSINLDKKLKELFK